MYHDDILSIGLSRGATVWARPHYMDPPPRNHVRHAAGVALQWVGNAAARAGATLTRPPKVTVPPEWLD
jgi:hypothetical protein